VIATCRTAALYVESYELNSTNHAGLPGGGRECCVVRLARNGGVDWDRSRPGGALGDEDGGFTSFTPIWSGRFAQPIFWAWWSGAMDEANAECRGGLHYPSAHHAYQGAGPPDDEPVRFTERPTICVSRYI